ncbi:MAG: hypothetical protein NW203_11570 [Hyphomonadaceae bacterium]|nr:hypothetical protein [Hyphomonadaceae bacterium]
MSPPDLATPEGRAAYRREINRVAAGPRLAGVVLALAGVGVGASRYFVDPWPPSLRYLALALCLAGIGLLLYGLYARMRHHFRRMAEKD